MNLGDLKPHPAHPRVHELAEGPSWDPGSGALQWVDIERGELLTGTLQEDGQVALTSVSTFADRVSCAARSIAGDTVIAVGTTLVRCDRLGGLTLITDAVPDRIDPATPWRYNDGKPDPSGRLIVGTLALDGESQRQVLARLEDDGSLTTIDDDLTLSNGLAWSTTLGLMFSVDTLSRRVFRRPYDAVSGEWGERQVLIHFDDEHPDGMCIDAEDHLWIAFWGSGETRRYSPAGRLVGSIRVAAPHTTCPVFAGPELETLVITTATQDLSSGALALYPDSGKIFTVKPCVRGAAATPWNGLAPSKGRTA